MIRFESVSVLEEEHRGAVFLWLRNHNIASNEAFVTAMEKGASKPLAVIARGSDGTMHGGLIAETLLDWLSKSSLPEQWHRRSIAGARRGIGQNARLHFGLR
jgi:hypothetical protein